MAERRSSLALCNFTTSWKSNRALPHLKWNSKARKEHVDPHSLQHWTASTWLALDHNNVKDMGAHYAKVSRADRRKWVQNVCHTALVQNLVRVQNWLLYRPDVMKYFVLGTYAFEPMPYTLEFVAEIAPPDLYMMKLIYQHLTSMTLTQWRCARNGISVESMLPLTPAQWETVFDSTTNVIPEWWLQLHLPGGHPVVFPPANSLEVFTWRSAPSEARLWLQDVLERGILIKMQSETDPSFLVPFVMPTLSDWLNIKFRDNNLLQPTLNGPSPSRHKAARD